MTTTNHEAMMKTTSRDILNRYPVPSNSGAGGPSPRMIKAIHGYRAGRNVPLDPEAVARTMKMTPPDAAAYVTLATHEGLRARQGRAAKTRRPAWAAALAIALANPDEMRLATSMTGASTATVASWAEGSVIPRQDEWDDLIVAFPTLERAPRPPQPWAVALVSARTEAGMSQGTLADRLGFRRDTVQTWEVGKSVPSDEAWRALIKVLPALEAVKQPRRGKR